jgi:predicted dehydrogenase
MPSEAQNPVGLAVLGAGKIGRSHVEHILDEDCAALTAIVDPMPDAKDFAAQTNTNWYPNLAVMLAQRRHGGACRCKN